MAECPYLGSSHMAIIYLFLFFQLAALFQIVCFGPFGRSTDRSAWDLGMQGRNKCKWPDG